MGCTERGWEELETMGRGGIRIGGKVVTGTLLHADGVGMAVVARDVRPWSRWWLWVGMKMMVDMGCFGVGDGCGAWPESWLDKNGAPEFVIVGEREEMEMRV
ncbi:hypothetical protein Tco_0459171 [Tanacetum coccineum]